MLGARAKGCHLSGVPTGRTEKPEERNFYHLNILEPDVFLGSTCSVVSSERTLAVKTDEGPGLSGSDQQARHPVTSLPTQRSSPLSKVVTQLTYEKRELKANLHSTNLMRVTILDLNCPCHSEAGGVTVPAGGVRTTY